MPRDIADITRALIARLPELTSSVTDWDYQSVVEGALVFQRAWRTLGTSRLHIHTHAPSHGAAPFWHPHMNAAAVVVLGPGGYRLELGATLKPELGNFACGPLPSDIVQRVAVVESPFPMYYALEPKTWHAVHVTGSLPVCSLYVLDSDATAAGEGAVDKTTLTKLQAMNLQAFVAAVRAKEKPSAA